MQNPFLFRSARILAVVSVFSLTLCSARAAPKFYVLHEFAGGADGAYPGVPLIDRSGNLFGIAGQGGSITDCNSFGCGAVFELSPKNGKWKESILYSFSSATGVYSNSAATAAMDSQGNIYGVGSDQLCSCGVVYKLARTGSGWILSVLHEFVGGASDGQSPSSGLIQDASGKMYGTTSYGGPNNYGVVFQLSLNSDGSWTYSVLYEFGSNGGYTDGQQPIGPIAIDSVGNIYGATQYGGEYSYGSVFKLAPSNGVWTETILHNFSLEYGQTPQPSGVALDNAGALYGLTATGGIYSLGTVYKLTPGIGLWNRTTLYTFTGGADGAYPLGGLFVSSSGALYGVTELGGNFGSGNVYELASTNGHWRQTVLHSFTNGVDGGRPSTGVTLDAQGNIFGQAADGGTYGFGTAFEITP
jgi:uncharacterized repeat protein (TIGR03803 family)